MADPKDTEAQAYAETVRAYLEAQEKYKEAVSAFMESVLESGGDLKDAPQPPQPPQRLKAPAKQRRTSKKRFRFTDLGLRKLKPAATAYDVRDALTPGLNLRVSPTGRKVFRWTYRDPLTKKNKVYNIGQLGEGPNQVSLSKARDLLKARKKRHEAMLEHGDELPDERCDTVAELASMFYRDRIEQQRKRPEEALAIINNDIVRVLGPRRLELLTAPAVSAMIADVVKRGAVVRAGKVLALTKQLFRFGVARGFMESNPAATLDPADLQIEPHGEGDRFLTGEEIKELYSVLPEGQIGIGIRILLLSAVRTGELIKAEWADVDLDAGTWTIPVKNQKCSLRHEAKHKPFTIHLPEQAVELFKELKTIAGNSSFVMSSRQSKTGHLSDKVFGKFVRKLFAQGKLSMPHFSPHDLRRTCRTHLNETLNVQPHICEKVLNHSLGKIEKTYNRAELLDQRAEALARWADWIDNVTGQGASNVKEIRQ